VPVCDFYNNGTAPRCSGFYVRALWNGNQVQLQRPINIFPLKRPTPPSPAQHDQEQTPNHPGGGKQYPVDGECIEQCDCGTVNPCGEYVSYRIAISNVALRPLLSCSLLVTTPTPLALTDLQSQQLGRGGWAVFPPVVYLRLHDLKWWVCCAAVCSLCGIQSHAVLISPPLTSFRNSLSQEPRHWRPSNDQSGMDGRLPHIEWFVKDAL
jgi:hypothetical protein